MELEQTDQEQVEALQKWWQENWLSLLAGLVIGLGGILGWQYYGEYKADQSMAASSAYEAIKTQLASDQLDGAAQAVASLQQDHANSPYVPQAYLAMAQAQAESGDWAAAAASLQQVAANTDDPALIGLANLRLARAQWAQGDAATAQQTLLADVPEAFSALYAELQGDIAFETGDVEAARSAWEKALNSQTVSDSAAIQRKLDMLP